MLIHTCGPAGPGWEKPKLAHAIQKVSYIVGLTAQRLAFLWDLNNTKWCNSFDIEFRQNFTKDTFSYDEHLKS